MLKIHNHTLIQIFQTGLISDGEHNIIIELVTEKGRVLQKIENRIKIDTKFFQIHIETIYDRNTITNEEHILSGWLMTNSNKQNIRLMIYTIISDYCMNT